MSVASLVPGIDSPYLKQVPAFVRLAACKHITDHHAGRDLVCDPLFLPLEIAQGSANQMRGACVGQHIRWRDTAQQAAMVAWTWAGRPTNSDPVTVDVIRFGARVMDDDNLWSALKPVRDWLFSYRCGTVPHRAELHVGRLAIDDSPRYVECGTIRQITGRQRGGVTQGWICLIVWRRDASASDG